MYNFAILQCPINYLVFIGPHCPYAIRRCGPPFPTAVARSAVCVLGTRVSYTKTDEPIEMQCGPNRPLLDEVQNPDYHGNGQLCGVFAWHQNQIR